MYKQSPNEPRRVHYLAWHSRYCRGCADREGAAVQHVVREAVEAGGLAAYGADVAEQYRRVATFVDKILRGARPGDLPIEQPTKFELVVNQKAARAIALTIPQSVLLRADAIVGWKSWFPCGRIAPLQPSGPAERQVGVRRGNAALGEAARQAAVNIHGARVEFVVLGPTPPLQWVRTRSSSTRGAESEIL